MKRCPLSQNLLTKWMIKLCRRSDELDGMGGCPIAIFILMTTHISNFEVLCIGSYIWVTSSINFTICKVLISLEVFHTSPYCLFSDGVDEYVVNKFLSQVFTGDENLQGKICSLVKETASRKFDMKEEVVLYCYFLFSILKFDVNVK